MNLKHIWLLLIGLVAAIGCGGAASGGGGEAGNLSVFATDSPTDDYSKVWITIYKVELVSDTGSAVVFDDPQGKLVDIRSLRDSSGERFLFLGNKRVELKNYTSARVTLSKSLSLLASGGSSVESKSFDDSFDNGSGKSSITFALTNGDQLGAIAKQLIVDFDLSNWTVNGSSVRLVVRHGSGNGVNDGLRHENEDHHGTVSGLAGTSPNFSFTLTMPNGSSFVVQTDTGTAIFNSNGAPSPALANGKFVEVRGTFSTTSNALLTTVVKIEDRNGNGGGNGGGNNGGGEANIKGGVSNVNGTAGTLTVSAGRVRRFVPTSTSVNVQVTDSTVYFNNSGIVISRDQFFASVQAAGFAEAEGSYNAATNTLTAFKVELEDNAGGGGSNGGSGGGNSGSGGGGNNGGAGDHHNAEIHGVPQNVNAGAGTFEVSIRSWQGFSGSSGQAIAVQTSGSTTYRDDNGNNISASSFFAALAAGSLLEVEGHLSNGILTASKAKLDNH